MALSDFIPNAKEGLIKLEDGAGNSLTVPYEKGNFKAGPFRAKLNTHVTYQSRGKLRGVGVGERIFPQIAWSAWLPELSNVLPGVVADFLFQKASYAANVSTLGSGHPVYAIHISWIVTLPNGKVQTVQCRSVVPEVDGLGDGGTEGSAIDIAGEMLGELYLDGAVHLAEVA